MDEYPNSDEEFELMHSNDFELLRELEESDVPKSRKSLSFTTPNHNSKVGSSQSTTQNENHNPNANLNSSFDKDFSPINTSFREDVLNVTEKTSAKRTVHELFGDIDDIAEDALTQNAPKKKKTDREADLELINEILDMRKRLQQQQTSIVHLNKHTEMLENDDNRYNLSYSFPRYSSIPVTRSDGERVYVRMHTKEYEKEDSADLIKESTAGVMGDNFKEIWKTVNENIAKKLQQKENKAGDSSVLNSVQLVRDPNTTQLWVDIYKPRKYMELLSDESTNRILLRWLKLWDRVVFNRKPKQKIHNAQQIVPASKYQMKQEMNMKLSADGRPEYKVALLCGPPGLGKTTLAHIVAKHAGYNIVEINASDERTTESFKHALETATQMRSIVDPDNRPNCLIFDEIDGAPAASIDLLVKYVTGTVKVKTKKGQKQKANVLKRPIICICNDVFVPALRPLRQIAFVVNFPPTVSSRLAERLTEIAKYQMLKTDLGALMALCSKTHNDIRSCLSVLQFFKVNGKPFTLNEVHKSSIGQLDMHKGLFEVWQDIFQIEKINLNERKPIMFSTEEESGSVLSKSLNLMKIRMSKILNTVQAFGDYERLMQGVYENYPKIKKKDASLLNTCKALEWFCLSDVFNQYIHSSQNYGLCAYLPYGFVVWHFVFASYGWQKIVYPSVGYEARTKTLRNNALVGEVMRGMRPSIRAYVNSKSLKLDLLPLISRIIVPSFRPVNLHLYTPKERLELNNVVNIMIDYNLNYVQERNADGNYEYNIDPNIDQIVNVRSAENVANSGIPVKHSSKTNRRSLSYSNKQLVAREIEMEKMRRIDVGKSAGVSAEDAAKKKTDVKTKEKDAKTDQNVPIIPNHLQRLQPKAVKPQVTVCKDFFGRIITKTSPENEKTGPQMGNDIWFCYKEGYNNAVRKTIKISSLK